MTKGRFLFLATLGGLTFLGSLAASSPTRAQGGEPPVRARMIIRGPDGERVIDVDPGQLNLGSGNNIIMMKMGPDGQVMSFSGDPGSFGFMNGPGGFNIVGPNGTMLGGGMDIIDPGRTYIYQLIKRDDVRSQILLTARQREALDASDKTQQDAMQQQMKINLQSLGSDLQGKSKEELQAAMQDRARQLQDQIKGMSDERDKRLAAILTPKQLARLKELDLQYRGPLAMGVKPVAELAKLTPEQAPKVFDLLKEYRQEVSKQFSLGVKTAGFNSKQGADSPSASNKNSAPAATQAEMQAKMEKAKKEIEKARRALGEKALKTLDDEHRAQWSTLTGRPFQFRTNL
jgi:hypothetical protein